MGLVFVLHMDRTRYLVLDVASIAPLVHLDSEDILTVYVHKRSDVELRGIPRSLRVPHLLSVHPNMERRIHTLESQSELITFESFGDSERTKIAPRLVVIIGNTRWIYREGVDDIGVSASSVNDPHLMYIGNTYCGPFP